MRLKLDNEVRVQHLQLDIRVESAHGFVQDVASHIGEFPSCASIDRDKVGENDLVVRSIRDGDRMRPLGMDGSRKLQDILVRDL